MFRRGKGENNNYIIISKYKIIKNSKILKQANKQIKVGLYDTKLYY